MADAVDVLRGISRKAGVSYPVLVPNVKGMETALQCGVQEIAVFGAASEAFTQKNIKCSIVRISSLKPCRTKACRGSRTLLPSPGKRTSRSGVTSLA